MTRLRLTEQGHDRRSMMKCAHLLALSLLGACPVWAQSFRVETNAEIFDPGPQIRVERLQNLAFGTVLIPAEGFTCVYAVDAPRTEILAGANQPIATSCQAHTNQWRSGVSTGRIFFTCAPNEEIQVSATVRDTIGWDNYRFTFDVTHIDIANDGLQPLEGKSVTVFCPANGQAAAYIGGQLIVPGTALPYSGTIATVTVDAV
jgi:hypothetical protein